MRASFAAGTFAGPPRPPPRPPLPAPWPAGGVCPCGPAGAWPWAKPSVAAPTTLAVPKRNSLRFMKWLQPSRDVRTVSPSALLAFPRQLRFRICGEFCRRRNRRGGWVESRLPRDRPSYTEPPPWDGREAAAVCSTRPLADRFDGAVVRKNSVQARMRDVNAHRRPCRSGSHPVQTPAPAVSVPLDLSRVRPGPIGVVRDGNSVSLTWPDETARVWRATFSLDPAQPLVTAIGPDGEPVVRSVSNRRMTVPP